MWHFYCPKESDEVLFFSINTPNPSSCLEKAIQCIVLEYRRFKHLLQKLNRGCKSDYYFESWNHNKLKIPPHITILKITKIVTKTIIWYTAEITLCSVRSYYSTSVFFWWDAIAFTLQVYNMKRSHLETDTLCGKGFKTYAERSAVTVCARGGHVLFVV